MRVCLCSMLKFNVIKVARCASNVEFYMLRVEEEFDRHYGKMLSWMYGCLSHSTCYKEVNLLNYVITGS